MKRIAIIGAGASGTYLALLLSKSPEFSVSLFDKEDQIGRKLKATGNGRCNLLNLNLSPERFSHPEFMGKILKEYPSDVLLSTLKELGIPTVSIGDLAYPASLSAPQHVAYLTRLMESRGVKFHLGAKLLDYRHAPEGYFLKTSRRNFGPYDELVFAFGGKSQPKLGSDGSLFSLLKEHGYSLVPIRPGLVPIEVREMMRGLNGVRHEAMVRVYDHGEQFFEEEGEVLFKDDGLSGIVIFNASSAIMRRPKSDAIRLELDLFPKLSKEELQEAVEKADLDAFLVPALKAHILSRGKDPVQVMKHLRYTFERTYPLSDSQVSIGGVSLKDVDASLASKVERNVHIMGEALDMDGDCGGYNLSWALISALIVAKDL